MKIYLDTSPLIYLIEGVASYRNRVASQIAQWIESDAILTTSSLTLMELLILPKKQQDYSLAKKYRALLQELLSEPLLIIDAEVAEKAAEIRAQYQFKTPDSIQLATAVLAGADLFYTNDLRLERFKGMKIITVDD